MDKNIHRWIGLVGGVVAAIGFIGWWSLNGTGSRQSGLAGAPPPHPQLSQFMPYTAPMAPMADSSSFALASSDSIVLRHDPFAAQAVAVAQSRHSGDAAPRPAVVEGEHWRVSATLVAGTHRAAVINDILIYVGDRLPGGGKLTSVERDRVVVTDAQGASHIIAVKEGDG